MARSDGTIFQQALDHHQAGRLQQAEQAYKRVLSVDPAHADSLYRLGMLACQAGRNDLAVGYIGRALQLRPFVPDYHFILGYAQANLGRLDAAERCYREVLRLGPNNPEVHSALGVILLSLGRLEEAVSSCREALRLDPNALTAHQSLGNAFGSLGRLSEAAASYREAIRLNPNSPATHHNLGNVLGSFGRPEEAVASYREALRLQPNFPLVHSSLLLTLNYLSDMTSEAIFAEHRRWDALHAAPLHPTTPSTEGPDRSPDRRLRVGYVSGDFRIHPVAYFLEPLLANHDTHEVEVFCYARVSAPDKTTERLKSLAEHWVSISGQAEAAIAQRIQADNIDVLVDLGGHTNGNQLLIFARKPAPVQVTWLGYPNTTGLNAMDYRITDAIADPPGVADGMYSERLERLPSGFLCYQPPQTAPAVSPLPASKRGFVTFGSFNNLAKVTPKVTATWASILCAVPRSRLLLKTKAFADIAVRQRYIELFATSGVTADRLDLLPQTTSVEDHLAAYDGVDIGLDPDPYNGTTTSCEAMWMGVPIVSMTGSRHAGRVGASLLSRVCLTDLIAANEMEYIAIAIRLANDIPNLARLRAGLRDRMRASPICDAFGFARTMENAYRRMWHRYCDHN